MELRPTPESSRRMGVVLTIVLALAVSRADDALHRRSSRPVPNPSGDHTAAKERIARNYGKLRLAFEENSGQTDADVKFLSRGSGYTLFLTSSEAVLALRNRSHERKPADTVLRMRLMGGSPAASVKGTDRLPGRSNYLIGRDPAKWRTGIARFGKVEYDQVYPGVDLVYYGNQGQLEYDFIVAPGADPRRIRMAFDGARAIRIDDGGDLVLQTAASPVRLQKPVIYQEANGRREMIPGGYSLDGDDSVTFRIDSYDAGRPLVIDPILMYSTYLGGGNHDLAVDVAVDAGGSAYVVGNTLSIDFPVASAVQPECRLVVQPGVAPCDDVFVTKLNHDGTGIEYSTYLGGTGTDVGNGIALDAAGNAYVVGTTTSNDFPTFHAVQDRFGSQPSFFPDAFVAKLSPGGSELVYSTYLGGHDEDSGHAIAVDAAGAAYVTGATYSPNFPTRGPLQWAHAGAQDAFITKLTPDGSELAYSAFLGGEGFDIGHDIVVSPEGHAMIVGETSSTTFPTVNALLHTNQGQTDGFIATVVPDGSALSYASYFGGPGADSARSIAFADQLRHLYIVGTTSGDFPVTDSQPFGGGQSDGFLAILNFDGILGFSKYLGGVDADQASGVAVDAAGNVYVTGATRSPDFPAINGLQAYAGNDDFFVTKFNDPLEIVYSTFVGGSGIEYGADGIVFRGPAVAVDFEGNAYVAGATGSPDVPTTAGAFQPVLRGDTNSLIAKIFDDGPGPAAVDVSLVEIDTEQVEGEVRYLFNITNHGPGPASEVTFYDSLPESVTFGAGFIVTHYGGSGTCAHDGNDVRCYLGVIPAGASAQVGLSVTSPTEPMVTNIAVVTLTETDRNPDNNEVRSTRMFPDLSMTGATEQHGTDLHYFFHIRNTGPARADGVRFTNVLPAGVALRDALFALETPTVPILSDCSYGDGVVACGVDTLLPGQTAFARIIVTPPGAAMLTSTATVALNGVDFDMQNNSVTLNTTFEEAQADLSIAYTRSSDVVVAGGTLTYTFDIANNGPSEATDVFMTESLAAGEALVSATTNRGGCDGTHTVFCSFGSMEAGAAARVTVVVRAVHDASLTNQATVTSSVLDPAPENNSVTIVTPVNRPPVANAGADQVVSAGASCQATVTLNGTASSDPDGDPLTYTWTSETLLPPPPPVVFSNGSGGALTGPTVTGPLPLGTHTILLTVNDGRGGVASDTVIVTVRDTTPPVFANVPPPMTLEQAGPLGTALSVPLPTATDNCPGPLFVTSDAPATFPAGLTTVTFRTCDASCNRATATTTVTVVDTTIPALNVFSPQARDYLHTENLTVAFSSVDGGSGLAPGAPSAVLDGVAVANGQTISLLTLALGQHTVVVSTADIAGNSTSRPVTFRIVATIESLIATVERFVADHSISDSGTANGLLAKLTDALDARDKGRTTVAVNKLRDFVDQVNARHDRISADAARTLIADAEYVIETLR